MEPNPWKLALKAYEAKTPSERLAAFTEIYDYYGIEMLPEEKEFLANATPSQLSDTPFPK
ncbi:hypothetical protein [Anaerovibrio sp. RM50]|uniref:hypothetical protein n=1 Tax=Anaerovibrio sp. RM50 TaxID=1200557 RepID=UPI0004879AA1|nr:hypothetical protein [Anaerovibrio sp. RM50]